MDNIQQQVITSAPVANCLPNILEFPIVQQHSERLSTALAGTRPTSEPIGLTSLRALCFDKYPDITQDDVGTQFEVIHTKKRFFHGGSDPLDFIYIFKNEEDSERSIPRHWHYVGFGLSDIYDYQYLCAIDMKLRSCDLNYAQNRIPLVQPYPSEHVNGFGLELTFRVKCNSDDSWSKKPPQWPASILQALARYVYQSKNTFSVGDHLWWQCTLDGDDNSHIEHMLMALDPQLGHAQTNLGRVTFIQLVGVFQEELEAARDWTANDVLDIMREQRETGGPLLVTDMQRQKTIFDLNKNNRGRVEAGIAEKGSDMTRITARHKTCARKPTWFIETENIQNRDSDMEDDCDLSTDSTHQLAEPASKEAPAQNGFRIERGNFDTMIRDDPHQFNSNSQRAPSRMSYESERALMFENLNLVNTRYYDSIYILLNYDTARIFLAVLTNRLAHQRPFTIGSFEGDMATIFVPEGAIVHSLVSSEQPYARNGILLQIYVPNELRKMIVETIRPDFCRTDSTISLPRNYSWPEFKFYITVVDEIKD